MTITRRTVLTGIGAAAITPALPSTAQPVYVEPLAVYGRSPLMIDGLPTLRALNYMIGDVVKGMDGKQYRCIASTNSAIDEATNSAGNRRTDKAGNTSILHRAR